MSYNGVGLTTPRGSGTSGYIVRNLSNLRPRDAAPASSLDDTPSIKYRAPDKEILEHEAKRKIEIQCLELEMKLQDEGDLSEEAIVDKVEELRQKLKKEHERMKGKLSGRDKGSIKSHETHELSARKADEMEKMRKAFGIASDYKEGDGFNRDLQEQKKQERIQQQREIAAARKRATDEARARAEERDAKMAAHKKEAARLQTTQAEVRKAPPPVAPPSPPSPRRESMNDDLVRGQDLRRTRRDSRSLSPPPRRVRDRSRSRSPPYRRAKAEPACRRRSSPPRSPSPPRKRRRSSFSNSDSSPNPPRSTSRVVPVPRGRNQSGSPPRRRRSSSSASSGMMSFSD